MALLAYRVTTPELMNDLQLPADAMRLHSKQFEVFRNRSRFRCVVAGRRFGKCQSFDTLVAMQDGSYQKLGTIKAGDQVLALNEATCELEPRTVQHVHDNGVREVITLTLTNGREITATPNHPFLVDGQWMELQDVEPGQLMAVSKRETSGKECSKYIPIRFEDFVAHLRPHSSRDTAELRELLKSWRKQSTSRISTRRYEQLRKFSDGHFDALLYGDLQFCEVESVKHEPEPQQTYDLTVEGHHNFVANSMITHNTVLSQAEIIKAASKPNKQVWYIAPTYRMAKQIMWREIRDVIPRRWVRKTNQTAMSIDLVNGSRIELKGSDDPDKLRGVALDFVVLDEFQAMRKETWSEAIRPTLATTGGQALFIGTPLLRNHLYDMYMQGQNPVNIKEGTFRSWQFVTADSPFIPPREIEMAKRELDPKTFGQEFLASFNLMSGRVYYAFNRDTHVADLPFNPNLPLWVGQDFNVDPMAASVMQWHPDLNQLWVIDEIVLPNSNTQEAVEELERRYWRNKRNTNIYPDATGANRSTSSFKSDIDIIRDSGYNRIKMRKVNPPVADRIAAVNRMLLSASGAVRMRVDRKCTHHIRAFEQVVYKPGSRDVDKSDDIEHILDACGYTVHAEFPTRKIHILGVNI